MLFSHSDLFDSLRPHGLQDTRLPCPSLSPGVCSNLHPLSRWYHITSHPLSLPSPHALSISQHQGLFQWVSSSHQVAGSLEVQLQPQSFPWMWKQWSPLGLTSRISLLSQGPSSTVRKHQLFGAQPSLWSNSHIHLCLREKSQLWVYRPLLAKWCLCLLIGCLGLL